MGRAERRKAERNNRIESRKGKILVSREDLAQIKDDITRNASGYSVEALMTCFALSERRLLRFGHKRILRSLQYIDSLMQNITDGTATIEDYKKILENETGVIVKCED